MLLHLVNLALPYNVVGVGAGEASRLQVAPHLRLAVGRPPVEEQLVLLQAHHSTQAHLVAVQWEAPVEEKDIFEVCTKNEHLSLLSNKISTEAVIGLGPEPS